MALTQIVTTDSVSASVVNTKIVDPANTAISGLQIAQTAGGTGTAITLTGIELIDGYQKTFVINANNNGAATTINGKPLYKPGGTLAPNLTAGKAATVWYNLAGDCFFYKASAEGTATSEDVLAGVTFSNDDDIGITGALSLIGTAGVGDVASGKTFYNTDAKTELTGTNTDKKWASGEITSSSNEVSFQYSGTTGTYLLPYVSVSGLNFTPRKVIISQGNKFTIYNSTDHLYYNPSAVVVQYPTTQSSLNFVASLKGDVANANVSFGQFTLPVLAGNTTQKWIAFE